MAAPNSQGRPARPVLWSRPGSHSGASGAAPAAMEGTGEDRLPGGGEGFELPVPFGPRTFVSTRFLPPGVREKKRPSYGGLTVPILFVCRYGADGEEGGPCRQLPAAIGFASSISAARLSRSRPSVSTANLRPLCR